MISETGCVCVKVDCSTFAEMCRNNKGLRERVDMLEMMQDPKTIRDKKRTPYEGIPQNFSAEEITRVTH